jgi:TRAP-type mannitol/chloroaromatic compound transport system permease small subunit
MRGTWRGRRVRAFGRAIPAIVRIACRGAAGSPAMHDSEMPSPALLKVIAVLEYPSVLVGKLGAWLILPMTAGLVYEVVSRYIFDAPTIWAYDMTYMFAGSLFMLGSAYALRQGSHVRADFLLSSRPPRWQAAIDVFLYVVVYFPAIALFLETSTTFALQSWQQGETFPQSPWMPIIYPLKTVIPVTLVLLLIQGVAELLKAIWTFRNNVAFRYRA